MGNGPWPDTANQMMRSALLPLAADDEVLHVIGQAGEAEARPMLSESGANDSGERLL